MLSEKIVLIAAETGTKNIVEFYPFGNSLQFDETFCATNRYFSY